eukprot:TRINITY_DN22086_c0_g1_i1.p4 TRINITY_DN22086_c0_g1~~TRINITY_DN22086_c0_g1_i1.p4  ORF type:complete len:105 (-),score=5.22 TRINITY_DN22086_c0_g1_i1:232-546(-)
MRLANKPLNIAGSTKRQAVSFAMGNRAVQTPQQEPCRNSTGKLPAAKKQQRPTADTSDSSKVFHRFTGTNRQPTIRHNQCQRQENPEVKPRGMTPPMLCVRQAT